MWLYSEWLWDIYIIYVYSYGISFYTVNRFICADMFSLTCMYESIQSVTCSRFLSFSFSFLSFTFWVWNRENCGFVYKENSKLSFNGEWYVILWYDHMNICSLFVDSEHSVWWQKGDLIQHFEGGNGMFSVLLQKSLLLLTFFGGAKLICRKAVFLPVKICFYWVLVLICSLLSYLSGVLQIKTRGCGIWVNDK